METKVIIAAIIGLIVGSGGVYAFTKDAAKLQPTVASKPQMQQSSSAMMTALEGKQGDAFDQAFIEQMTIHHQGAIQMAEMALRSAGHTEIKQLAGDIISAQNTEIQQMQEWQVSWYGAQAPITPNDTAQPGGAVHNMQ